MTTLRSTTLSAAIAAILLVGTGCGEQIQQAAATAQQKIDAATAQDGKAATAMEEARQKLRTENLELRAPEGVQAPSAAITPEGQLLINGQPVPMTDAQLAAGLKFREEMIVVADAGIDMGQDGLAMAGQATSLAVASLFDGNVEELAARMEAEGAKLESKGQALCAKMETLSAAQNALAAAVPEFQPYAKTFEGTFDCGQSALSDAQAPAADAKDADVLPKVLGVHLGALDSFAEAAARHGVDGSAVGDGDESFKVLVVHCGASLCLVVVPHGLCRNLQTIIKNLFN